jgi:hypothetical protein
MAKTGPDRAPRLFLLQRARRKLYLASTAFVVLVVAAAVNTAAPQSPPEEEYGEFLARPKELTSVLVNDIAKSIRLNASARLLGK